MNNTPKKLLWLFVALILLGLGACKMDMDQEIWLNKDESGRAKVAVKLNIPMAYDEETMGEMDLTGNSALKELAERAKETEGIDITRYDTEADNTAEEMNYIYTMEFTFKDLKGLSNVMCTDPTKGITLQKTKKGKQLSMDPRNFLVQVEGSEEDMEYISLIGMSLNTIIHLPKKPKSVDTSGTMNKKTKTATWNYILDEAWYAETDKIMTVVF